MSTFPVPNPITTSWLTATLQQVGLLSHGAVAALTQCATDAFNSDTSFLEVTYIDEVSSALPTHFVLKQNGAADWAKAAGATEVLFYRHIANLSDHPAIIPPCYAAVYDEESGNSFLLLRDLSATHRPPVTRAQQIDLDGVPPKMAIGAVVDALAQLHAYWWEHPLLSAETFTVGHWTRNTERFAEYLVRRCQSWAQLHAQEASWFPAELATFYTALLDGLETHWAAHLAPRFAEQQQLTLVHGDAYFANFLVPTDLTTGHTYLLDWQSPSFDLGTYDLVNLVATFWTPQQRHHLDREMSILQRYHQGLQRHGVHNYSWDELLTDYRSALVFWVLMPIQDGADGAPRSYWWPKLQCLIAAFEEWECAALLGR